MIDLDQPRQFGPVDQSGVIQRILDLPSQVRAAWALAQRLDLPPSHAGAANIVICGMGGSAIGGALTGSLAEIEARVPLTVIRGYDLPRFVGSQSLVLVASFSGATEETLWACESALQAGARMLALTTGGALARRARDAGFPLVQFTYAGQPREAVGYSVLLTLGVLTRLGYLPDRTTDVEATATLLQQMAAEFGPEVPTRMNSAKRLAQRLYGRVGVIYGGGLMSEVARRWKNQLNENAKHWALFEQLPELNHNAILGYQFPAGVADRVLVIILSSALNHPRMAIREGLTMELVGRWGMISEQVHARGSTPLQQILSASYVGDFVSYYLALINDVDPGDISTLTFFKARLAQEPGAGADGPLAESPRGPLKR